MGESSRNSIVLSVVTGIVAGVIVAIIFYLLPNKTPGLVFILLSLLFLLPTALMWIFWPKKKAWLGVIITVALFGLVVAFGSYAWPSEAPIFFAWLAPKIYFVRDLRWYWFLAVGAVLGIPLGMVLQHRGRTLMKETIAESLRVKELQLIAANRLRNEDKEIIQKLAGDVERLKGESARNADLARMHSEGADVRQNQLDRFKGLIKRFDDDKSEIADLVRICGIDFIDELDTGKLNPHIDFKIAVLNLSLHPVSIKPTDGESIKGHIGFQNGGHFRSQNLKESPRMVENEAQNIGFRETGYFTLRQFSEGNELQTLRQCSKESEFWFSNLVVRMEGEGIDERLKTLHHVQKNGRWFPFGEPQLSFAFNRDSDLAIAQKLRKMLDEDSDPTGGLILPGSSRLQAIADNQAKAIYQFVHLTMVRIGKHELLREHPYIDLEFTVDNRSLYDISFGDLSGAISFADRELTEQPAWQTRPIITQGNGGSVTIRERLTEGDVTRILNGIPSNKFNFSRLDVRVTSTDGVEPTALHASHLSLTNESLVAAYPKLEIKIARAIYDWATDMRTGPRSNPREPLYISMRLAITNHRVVTIVIETIKIMLHFNLKTYVSFAEDAVYSRRYTSEQGIESVEGENRENLRRSPPLSLVEGQSAEGTLQFVIKELDLLEVIADSVKDPDLLSLNKGQVTLLLIDQSGEKHIQHATPKEKQMFEFI
jgi:hypothetical protein